MGTQAAGCSSEVESKNIWAAEPPQWSIEDIEYVILERERERERKFFPIFIYFGVLNLHRIVAYR